MSRTFFFFFSSNLVKNFLNALHLLFPSTLPYTLPLFQICRKTETKTGIKKPFHFLGAEIQIQEAEFQRWHSEDTGVEEEFS